MYQNCIGQVVCDLLYKKFTKRKVFFYLLKTNLNMINQIQSLISYLTINKSICLKKVNSCNDYFNEISKNSMI